ncbi:MAG: hypothetical protein HW406_2829 [Candidatus Brocadiaceae bacterium]|nr:hypothetical protein [Candidatus Brocadiaceae bacterium]
MIKSFRDKGTEDIFDRKNTREARKTCPQQIWQTAQRKLDQLNGVVSLASLKIPPGNPCWKSLRMIEKDSTVYGLTISSESVLCGMMMV